MAEEQEIQNIYIKVAQTESRVNSIQQELTEHKKDFRAHEDHDHNRFKDVIQKMDSIKEHNQRTASKTDRNTTYMIAAWSVISILITVSLAVFIKFYGD